MRLCDNCLERSDTVKDIPVGHDKGSQRDPYRVNVALCEPCGGALLDGDWSIIHERFSAERTVRR